MWTIKIEVRGNTFDWVKQLVAREAKLIASEKDYRALGHSSGGDGGYAHIEVTCPVEQQIKQLRADADALEAKLQAGEL